MALSVEDQLTIQQLYARYNQSIDAGRADEWAACFTPEGVFSSATGTFTGTAALAEFATNFAKRLKARHWTNNLVLDATDGGAKASCYLLLMRIEEGKPASVLANGIYDDRLVKAGDSWKFASRTMNGD